MKFFLYLKFTHTKWPDLLIYKMTCPTQIQNDLSYLYKKWPDLLIYTKWPDLLTYKTTCPTHTYKKEMPYSHIQNDTLLPYKMTCPTHTYKNEMPYSQIQNDLSYLYKKLPDLLTCTKRNVLLTYTKSECPTHVHVPYVDALVEGAAGEVLAVGAEGHAVDGLLVLGQRVQTRAAVHLPESNRRVERRAETVTVTGHTPSHLLYHNNRYNVVTSMLHKNFNFWTLHAKYLNWCFQLK